MANSTVYDIRLRYMLEDKASKGVVGLERNMKKTAKSAGFLAKGFGRMAAAAGAAFGVRAAAKSLIGFNASMEQSKIQIQGMLTLGGKMDSAMANTKATQLFKDLQKHAKASVGTTADMVAMTSMIARPVMAAGLGMKDLGNFTAQAVVASKAFGIQSDMAARDIESAMMGQLRSVDRFSRNLLEPLGYVGDEGRKMFNELGASARAAKLKEALASPAIAEMAKQQAASFDGVLSTFQDGLQMALGRVGKPLFAALTEEIKSWSAWMDKNKATLDKMGQSIGRGLVKGFKVVKGVLGFMVDHASTLLLVAKAWAAIKVGSMVSQGIGGVAGMLGHGGGGAAGMFRKLGFDKLGGKMEGFGSKLAGVAGKLGIFAGAMGIAITAIYAFEDWMNAERDADLKQKEGEKAEAMAATKNIETLGITKLDAGIYENSTQLNEGLKLDQERRAEALKAAKAAGLKGEDAAYFSRMTPEEVQLSKIAVEGLPDRQKFFAEAATMAKSIGAINEFGGVKGTSDELDAAGRRYYGVAEGKDGVAGGVAEVRVMNALSDLRTELAGIAVGADRQEALRLMQLGKYVEGPTARAQEELDAMNQPDGAAKKTKVNVTIQRIEVASDDPDRFVFQLSETVKKLSRSPSQAANTQKLGG
jgi:hypothetical protein